MLHRILLATGGVCLTIASVGLGRDAARGWGANDGVADAAALRVGGFNQACFGADCPCSGCFQSGTGGNGYPMCMSQDDYGTTDQYWCSTQPMWTCGLGSWGPCYDTQTCGPSITQCGYRDFYLCACNSAWNGPCTTVTTNAWTSCTNTPPN